MVAPPFSENATTVCHRPFQRRFIRAIESGRYDRAALSLPRGNGKSWLAAHLAVRALTPGDRLFAAGCESVLLAASLEQSRIVFRFIRAALEGDPAYRFQDSSTRVGVVHRPTNTRIRALGSNGKTAFGLGADTRFAIADEPGAWENAGGQLLADAIDTSLGKVGSRMMAIYIGTIAPASRGWWPALIEGGSAGRTYVQSLAGDPDAWDRWPTIRRCNPLTAISRQFRAKLIEERDAARRDGRLRARFLSYRLNLPTADPASVLLTVEDWKRTVGRAVPPREGRPVVGVDLGGGRAWSAAVAVWRNGRTEARAIAPGLPSLAEQERRDQVPRGTYQRLAEAGTLTTDGARRVPRAAALVDALRPWGPVVVVCDRFRLAELQDAGPGLRLVPRVARWSSASEDIRALRRSAADGPLSVARESRALVEASLAVALVKTDDQGGVRLAKRANNVARDDVAAALVLACGAVSRLPVPRPVRMHVA